ncbi:cytochrome P450 [Rhodococcus oryzae]|uniref:cytochrome P450 n=1 Tax=Rhodococcus oryzae TaxID=2571143 RepID=UPI0037B923C6
MAQPPLLGTSRAALAETYDRGRLAFLLDAAALGPIVELWPGTFLVSGHREVHDVLVGSNRKFLSTQNFLRSKVSGDLGSESVQRWMKSRKAASAALASRRRLEDHQVELAHDTNAIVGSWLGRTVGDRELIDTLQILTSTSITRYCFGTRNSDEIPALAQELLDALFPITASPFVLPRWLRWRPSDLRVRRALRTLESAVAKLAQAPGSDGLCDDLRQADLPLKDVVQMIISTLLAAHGVPASAILWGMVELGARSALQEQLRGEGGAGALTRVVSETLRLWPPSWMLGRDAAEDIPFGDWEMKAGSVVMVSSWVTHRVSPTFASTGGDFRPERWIDAAPERGEFIPFGGGPRWCVGAKFAEREMSTVLGEIVRNSTMRIQLSGAELKVNERRTLTPEGFSMRFYLPEGT